MLARIAPIVTAHLLAGTAAARGVSPYLPLKLEPEIERQIERVLILADKPVITRPIAAATVRDALPAACAKDRPLCERVARYLSRFMPSTAITLLGIEAATDSGDEIVLANRHGLASSSAWSASARLHWQLFDHALVSAGVVAYDGLTTATGSLLSLGFDVAQLDLGYREHQLSPFTDSAMLISAHAPAMPSVTLSNYVPLTRLGIKYELFLAEMTESSRIVSGDSLTTGEPLLAGTHVAIEPVPGYSLGASRLIQFGGGDRGGQSFSDFWRAFFNPSRFDNRGANLSADEEFGNQLGGFTSRLLYPGNTPFAVYFEYAGEDTSRGRNYLLGNSALSIGLDFPKLPGGLDATFEVSEWQNGWYVNSLYGDGLVNEARGIGHWLADRRARGDAVGGQSQMLRVGWTPKFGGEFEFRYRTLENEDYGSVDYDRSQEFAVAYSRAFAQLRVGAEVQTGSDVFGESYSRVAAFFRFVGESSGTVGWLEEENGRPADPGAELFVNVGATMSRVDIDLELNDAAQLKSDTRAGAHFAVGVRRAASGRSDVGARIEVDEVDNRALLGVRAVDYRYRFNDRVALSGFIGAARYDLATPAYGTYLGLGAEWREVIPGWSIGADLKYAIKVARDRVLPEEAGQFTREDAFYDIAAATFSISKKF
jgi:hypothetical protein